MSSAGSTRDAIGFAEDLRRMTVALTEICRDGQRDLTAPEAGIALQAHRSVLDLARLLHGDLTGLRPKRGVTRISDLERHPVDALGRALARHPRPEVDLAPSQALAIVPTTLPGKAWRTVGRHAILAAHQWSVGHGPPLDDAARWKGVEEVAAICCQLVALEPELADVIEASSPDRTEAVAALRRGSTSGLAASGRETRRLCAAGPLPASGPDRLVSPVAGARQVIAAHSVHQLPDTQHRLAALLDATPLRAERLSTHARALALCCQRVGDSIGADEPLWADVRRELHQQAQLLRGAAVRPGGMVSLDRDGVRSPGTPALPEMAIRQAAEAWQGLDRHWPTTAPDTQLLGEYTDALARSTQALAGALDRAVAAGGWMVPNPDASYRESIWVPLHPRATGPASVRAVRAAATHADTLAAAARDARARSGATPAPEPGPAVARPLAGPRPAATPALSLIDASIRGRPRLPSHPVVSARARRR